MSPFADFAVRDDDAGLDDAVSAQAGGAAQMDIGMDDAVRGDLHRGVDIGDGRIDEGDAGAHVRLVDTPPQDGIGLGQLHAVVDPHRLIGVGHRQGPHRQPLGAGDLEHVGQIVFPLGVVAADGAQRFENQRRLKSVDTRIDLVDGLLLGGGVLLFDDAQHRLAVTDNAPVAVGIGHLGGKDGDRRLLFGMVGKKALQGLATQERHVAAQEKQGAGKVA